MTSVGAVVSFDFTPPDLPVADVVPDLLAALAERGTAVLAAPPGAGKTTVVPLALLDADWLGDRTIVMLEPRRLATRAAAERMAALTGTRVGELVGYQTRDERRIGPGARIHVLTEGVLTRRLQNDPSLPDVGAVIFDEVHERNLPGDIGLTFTLFTRSQLRPDLRLLAMSATADTRRLADFLVNAEPTSDGDVATPGAQRRRVPVISSDGRMHPVDIRWLPRGRRERLETAVVSAVRRALRDEHGDVLVFLPGIGEILRVQSELRAAIGEHPSGGTVDIRPLAGALHRDDHDAALAPSPHGRRRVVLATDIAETSLTVEGVRIVVDSGLAREPRFDPATEMTRLTTVAISRDSAEQRAGRAGRVEPGVVYRLWSKVEHGTRPAHRVPEIKQVDLTGLVLEIEAFPCLQDELHWLDPPPDRALDSAYATLQEIGALDESRTITPLGRAMLALPVHPRLARMVLVDESPLGCVLAALVEERDIMRGRLDELPVDLALRVRAVMGEGDDRVDRRAVQRIRERAADLARRAGISFDLGAVDPDRAGAVLLHGFPERIAGRRRPGQFQLVTGAGAWIRGTDPLAHEPFVVAADLDGNKTRARIRLAAALDVDDIAPVMQRSIIESRRLEWDRDRDDLVVRVERRCGALRLDEQIRRPEPGDETTAALIDRVRNTHLAVLGWTAASLSLRARVEFLHRTVGGPWPDWSEQTLVATLDTWLAPYLVGMTSRTDLESLDMAVLLRSQLPWPEGADLDALAPPSLELPNGRSVPIDYGGDAPSASVRVQDLFGVTDHPTAGGVPIMLELLSPADRPIQVTSDLPGFWAGSWADVRKEMAGRYPKHHWPDDPASAPPRRLKDR